MLAVSGKLNLKAGGPSVMVPVDPDLVKFLYKPSQWAVTSDRTEHDRRSSTCGETQPPAAVHGNVRSARSAFELCAPGIEHARTAGARNDERPARQRGRGGVCRAARARAGPDHRQIVERAYQLALGRAPNADERQFHLDFSRLSRCVSSRSRSSTSTPFSMHPDAPREHARLARAPRISPRQLLPSAGWRLPRSCMRRPCGIRRRQIRSRPRRRRCRRRRSR